MKNEKLKPLLKWTGGKTQELPIIKKHFPSSFNNFFEPFLGGGAVWLSIDENKHSCFVNDFSKELIYFYNFVKQKNTIFFNFLSDFNTQWDFLTSFVSEKYSEELYSFYIDFKSLRFLDLQNSEEALLNNLDNFLFDKKDLFLFLNDKELLFDFYKKYIFDKFKRIFINEEKKGDMTRTEVLTNIETGFKSSLYMFVRYKYNLLRFKTNNIELWISLYYILRNYSYSGMFRYNKQGDFNVPYGGNSYNTKSLYDKMNYLKNEKILSHLNATTLVQGDFEDFLSLKFIPTEDDFIFLDPPYDSAFSAYEGNSFDKEEQIRLANYLINKCKAKWMLVIKYTDFIFDLYNKDKINILSFDKKYQVSFMGRNEQKVEHIIIKNY